MPNKPLSLAESVRKGLVLIEGTFTLGSSGAVASSDTPGVTVTRDSAGQYDLAFTTAYPGHTFLAAEVEDNDATLSDGGAKLAAVDLTSKTAKLLTFALGTPTTEADLASGLKVTYCILAKSSSDD